MKNNFFLYICLILLSSAFCFGENVSFSIKEILCDKSASEITQIYNPDGTVALQGKLIFQKIYKNVSLNEFNTFAEQTDTFWSDIKFNLIDEGEKNYLWLKLDYQSKNLASVAMIDGSKIDNFLSYNVKQSCNLRINRPLVLGGITKVFADKSNIDEPKKTMFLIVEVIQ